MVGIKDLGMKKILFLHGFFATGSCPMAKALQEAFVGKAVVLTPDLPLHPREALKAISTIIDREQPDLLLGNSCGAFLAQMLAPVVDIPALLGNPHFKMTEFLKERIGEHEYKAPRRDGNQRLVIDEALYLYLIRDENIAGICPRNRYHYGGSGLLWQSNLKRRRNN